MTRVPADYNISGIFPRECPRGKERCYNGNGIRCEHLLEHNGRPGRWEKVTALCSAPTVSKKGKTP